MGDDESEEDGRKKQAVIIKPARRGRPPLNSSEAPKKEDTREVHQTDIVVGDNDDQEIKKFLKDDQLENSRSQNKHIFIEFSKT